MKFNSNKKEMYDRIMTNAAKTVKSLIESGASYNRISQLVSEMAVETKNLYIPQNIVRNVDDVWNGNYSKDEDKCIRDINHPDWVNLPKGRATNLEYEMDGRKRVRELSDAEKLDNIRNTYVYALRTCWSDCPETVEDAIDNNVMVNLVNRYDELGGDWNDVIELYNKAGKSTTPKDFKGRGPREKAPKYDENGNEIVAPKKEAKPRKMKTEKPTIFSIDDETKTLKYKEIPTLEISGPEDIVDVEPTEEDVRIAREAEERMQNGDVKKDDPVPVETAQDIKADEAEEKDMVSILAPGETVVSTEVHSAEENEDAPEEIAQVEAELAEVNAQADEDAQAEDAEAKNDMDTAEAEGEVEDDEEDVFDISQNSADTDDEEPAAEEPVEDDFDADLDSSDEDEDDVFDISKGNTDDEEERDYPSYEDVKTDSNSSYDAEEEDDVFDISKHMSDDEDEEEVKDEIENAEAAVDTKDEEEDDVFDISKPSVPDYDEVEPEQKPEPEPEKKPEDNKKVSGNVITVGNLMSGNIEEYCDPEMNRVYAENYNESFVKINDKGEIGVDFIIKNCDTKQTTEHTVYRDTIAEIFDLQNIFVNGVSNTDFSALKVTINIANRTMRTRVFRKYIDAAEQDDPEYNDNIDKIGEEITKLMNAHKIFNSIDDVIKELDNKFELNL